MCKDALRQGWTVRAECINTRKRTGFIKDKYGLLLGIVKIAVLAVIINYSIIWLFIRFA